MIKAIYDAFQEEKAIYEKIWKYYKGETDAKTNYKQTDRSNLVTGCNYIKKFVKEETSYSVGNPISYSSKKGISEAIDLLGNMSENFTENHDTNVFTNMVLFGVGYEIYYIDKYDCFQTKAVKPTEGYGIEGDDGTLETFIRVYNKQELVNGRLEWIEYAELYTEEEIITYRKNNDSFTEVKREVHYFGECPVGYAPLSELKHGDTIYNDIKELQDCLETNFSDIVNEISDFRNAYLVLSGLSLDDNEDTATMKENGVIEIPTPEGRAEWLIKNINDGFIQNTLKNLQEKIYEISSHINTNDNEQMSNASGVALKSRLISLMQRCKSNENAYKELLKTRNRIMFHYADIKGMGAYDWKDIKSVFSALIPSDDTVNADIIAKLDGIVSKETLLNLLSFVENPAEEMKKVDKQNSIYEDTTEVKNPFKGGTEEE